MGVGEARIREKEFHRGNKIRFRKVVVFARFEAIVISVDRNVFLRPIENSHLSAVFIRNFSKRIERVVNSTTLFKRIITGREFELQMAVVKFVSTIARESRCESIMRSLSR